MFFELVHEDKNTRARAGIIHTAHGDIPTPIFMPVGTQATVKTLDSGDLLSLNAPIILANNYHLHLRPGEDLVAQAGGVHKFMNWDRPVLTDSGGFQVFSLGARKTKKQGVILSPSASLRINSANNPLNTDSQTYTRDPFPPQAGQDDENEQGGLVDIDEDGVSFQSHIDGSKHRFTPESAIECQHKIGADIIMAFDECTPDNADYDYTKEAMERTHRWAKRCIDEHERLNELDRDPSSPRTAGAMLRMTNNYPQYLFGIIQGSRHKDLREESAKFICAQNFDGIAVGGESIGYNMEATKEILDWVHPFLPKDKPHYAMGLGLDPSDLVTVVEKGIDMFDCVAPTRLARHGMLFVNKNIDPKRRINITNAKFTKDFTPIGSACICSTCKNYTRAYLHHLFNAQEITAMRLATIHNLHFMLELSRQMRQAILADKFSEFKKEW